jgi:hypothetical protein
MEYQNREFQSKDFQQKSWRELLHEAVANVQDIVRGEMRLAVSEAKEEASKAGRATALLAAGAVFGLYALGFLLLAGVYALAMILEPWLAALIVGGVAAAVAAALVAVGKERIRQVHPKPEETISSIKENLQWARHKVR